MFPKSAAISIQTRFSSGIFPKLLSTDVLSINRKKEYYKKLAKTAMESDPNVVPKGWDEALPFESIPGPKPLPLIGNIHRFIPGGTYYGKPLHVLYETLYNEYGNIAVLKGVPARKALILAFDPKDMEIMLRNEGAWPIRYGVLPYVHYKNVTRKELFNGCGGVLATQGEEWFEARSKLNPILTEPRMVKKYTSDIDSVSDGLINLIRFHKNNSPINEMPENFQQEIYKWSLESIAKITLDVNIGTLDVNLPKNSPLLKYINGVNRMFDLMFDLEITPSYWKHVPTPRWVEFVKNLDNLVATNMKYIDETIATPDDPNKLEHQKSISRRLVNIDRDLAVATTVDLMLAGVDTTGKALAAILYFLARNPDKQSKLREEVLTKLPSKSSKVTAEDLTRAPYLRAVIKESMRIVPIAVGVLRTTVKNLVLGGYQIPKGSEVLTMNLHATNNDNYFKRAKEFIPERWLKSMESDELSSKNVNNCAFLPFGFGPRTCLGKRLANLELEVATMKVIRNFELSWHHSDMKFDSTLLYAIADPLKVRVKELNY